MNRSIAIAFIIPSLAAFASAQSNLPTADEAMDKSQLTGRPVFAMAGQET